MVMSSKKLSRGRVGGRRAGVVLMEKDVPDRMKLRIWKMIADWKGLHFIWVMIDKKGSEAWLLAQVMFTELCFITNSPQKSVLNLR